MKQPANPSNEERNSNLRHRLIECLETALGRRPPIRGAAVLTATRELDRISAEHRYEVPSELIHYLEKRSYLNALHWLEQHADSPRRRAN